MKKETLINNINKFIKAKGIKQNWIADMLDMDKMTINNILKFKSKKVDLDDLENIANVLDLSIDELSNENFEVKQDVFDNIQNQEPTIAFCANIKDAETIGTIEDLIGIINVIDLVKTANKKITSLDF